MNAQSWFVAVATIGLSGLANGFLLRSDLDCATRLISLDRTSKPTVGAQVYPSLSQLNGKDDPGPDEDEDEDEDDGDRLTCTNIVCRCITGWDEKEEDILQRCANKNRDTNPIQIQLSHTFSSLLIWQQPPRLTEIDKNRKEEELFHLTSLALEGDAALSKLMRLWFMERGETAARELGGAEWLYRTGNWDEAELCLYGLVVKYGIHWVEPMNRLALLLFHRGKLEESRQLLDAVLAVKPWHLGAQKGMATVYEKMENVRDSKKWVDRCLPPMDQEKLGSKRTDWVWLAVNYACGALDRAVELLEEENDDTAEEEYIDSEDDDLDEFNKDVLRGAWQ